jgi:hypothetical protein
MLESESVTIPKPKGVVGRIKEGGYSLIRVLGWEKEQYNEIQVVWPLPCHANIEEFLLGICSKAGRHTL